MDEVLHPANEVPGGLWMGAAVHGRGTTCDCRRGPHGPAVVARSRGGACDMMYSDRLASLQDESELQLILPGPLGLGLAGLAARVAERLGFVRITCPVALLDAVQRFDRTRWLNALVMEHCTYEGGIIRSWCGLATAWLASYLALTDRLCAAVGLELQPGEVARWERLIDGCWVLTASSGMWTCWPGEVSLKCDTDNALDAARAALREVTG